jgi:hypothetical protein
VGKVKVVAPLETESASLPFAKISPLAVNPVIVPPTLKVLVTHVT